MPKECRMDSINDIKINGLFFDYSGTISPLDVARGESRVLPQLEALLNVIHGSIPIGIITTKDLSFIVPRTLFADAWYSIAGMEMKIGSQMFVTQGTEKFLPDLIQALVFAKQNIRCGAIVEEKCDYRGLPLGFCVDWRQIQDKRKTRSVCLPILEYCKSLPLKVIEYPGEPYFDVYPRFLDKGQALNRMLQKLGLSTGVLYLGDSVTDNAAFKQADISIGVTSGKMPVELDCDYWIKFGDVANFLSFLYKSNFYFSPDLPGIKAMDNDVDAGVTNKSTG